MAKIDFMDFASKVAVKEAFRIIVASKIILKESFNLCHQVNWPGYYFYFLLLVRLHFDLLLRSQEDQHCHKLIDLFKLGQFSIHSTDLNSIKHLAQNRPI